MSSAPSPLQVGGLVPNVWFDLFGRIIPAAYLLLGIGADFWNSQPTVSLREYLEKHPVTGLPIAFLVFIGTTYMVGWLLGTASYWLIEFPVSRIRARRPSPMVPKSIEKIITKHCGEGWSNDLSAEQVKRKARDHCTYLIWHNDPALAIIFGRWDAESLGARTTVLATLILMGFAFFMHQKAVVFVVLIVIAGLSLEAYRYHSNRALNARVDMVLALFGSQQTAVQGVTTHPLTR